MKDIFRETWNKITSNTINNFIIHIELNIYQYKAININIIKIILKKEIDYIDRLTKITKYNRKHLAGKSITKFTTGYWFYTGTKRKN